MDCCCLLITASRHHQRREVIEGGGDINALNERLQDYMNLKIIMTRMDKSFIINMAILHKNS